MFIGICIELKVESESDSWCQISFHNFLMLIWKRKIGNHENTSVVLIGSRYHEHFMWHLFISKDI